ncbi:YraN family protein [Sphingobacterium corticis]|uniref:UPF0102 protein ACFSQ3_03560 n=1 Tax=Sphingobacterium corticis TaxID=1812823 RepID=A0ABW5NJ15_9SPHI
MTTQKETGNFGEQQAQAYLQSCGYEILAVNWQYKHLEADIIMRDGAVLVFVEVKTRSSVSFGHPQEFVDEKKQERLFRLAEVYVDEVEHQGDIRFDIVSIISKNGLQIEHIKDAFWHY